MHDLANDNDDDVSSLFLSVHTLEGEDEHEEKHEENNSSNNHVISFSKQCTLLLPPSEDFSLHS